LFVIPEILRNLRRKIGKDGDGEEKTRKESKLRRNLNSTVMPKKNVQLRRNIGRPKGNRRCDQKTQETWGKRGLVNERGGEEVKGH